MAGDLAGLSALAPTSSLIELTPGPNMACLALVAATKGRRQGLCCGARDGAGTGGRGGVDVRKDIEGGGWQISR